MPDPALERLRAQRQSVFDLNRAETERLKSIVGAADRIKFALGSGAMEEGERHLQAVRGLVDDLEARLAPQAPDGKAA